MRIYDVLDRSKPYLTHRCFFNLDTLKTRLNKAFALIKHIYSIEMHVVFLRVLAQKTFNKLSNYYPKTGLADLLGI